MHLTAMNTIPQYFLHKFWGALRLLEEIGAEESPVQILEIGCGVGITSEYIAARFPKAHLTAVDLDEEKLQEAKESESRGGIDYQMVDATAMPFGENSFDTCFAFLTFHHIQDYRNAFSEIHRVLKPGGKFYIFDVATRYVNVVHPLSPWWRMEDMTVFDKTEIESALRAAGLQILKSGGKRQFRLAAFKQ